MARPIGTVLKVSNTWLISLRTAHTCWHISRCTLPMAENKVKTCLTRITSFRLYRLQRTFSEQIEQGAAHFIYTQSRWYCQFSLCLTAQITYVGVPCTWGTCVNYGNYQTRNQNHTYDCSLENVWLSVSQSLSVLLELTCAWSKP